MKAEGPVLVLGASGQIGHFLVPGLLDAGFEVRAVSRAAPSHRRAGLTWITHDFSVGPAPVEAGILISAGPLAHAAIQLEALPGPVRVVAFSSASLHTKRASADPHERAQMAGLGEAEARLEAVAIARQVRLTLFRPALIYGGPGNANVELVARLSRRMRWIPVAGDGLRQPVHAGDLARVAIEAVRREAPLRPEVFDLGGGEVLGYREFIRRISVDRGRAVRTVTVPAPILKSALWLAHRAGCLHQIRPVMIDRQRQDLVIDDRLARECLGWSPRPFIPGAGSGPKKDPTRIQAQ